MFQISLGLEWNDFFFCIFQAKEDDFEKFDCLAFINAAENLLTLGKGLHYQKNRCCFSTQGSLRLSEQRSRALQRSLRYT